MRRTDGRSGRRRREARGIGGRRSFPRHGLSRAGRLLGRRIAAGRVAFQGIPGQSIRTREFYHVWASPSMGGKKGTVPICAATDAARRCPPSGRSGKWGLSPFSRIAQHGVSSSHGRKNYPASHNTGPGEDRSGMAEKTMLKLLSNDSLTFCPRCVSWIDPRRRRFDSGGLPCCFCTFAENFLENPLDRECIPVKEYIQEWKRNSGADGLFRARRSRQIPPCRDGQG